MDSYAQVCGYVSIDLCAWVAVDVVPLCGFSVYRCLVYLPLIFFFLLGFSFLVLLSVVCTLFRSLVC